jgi:hypothetical protein
MTASSFKTDSLAALLKHAVAERDRCETLACESEGIDSQLADGCRFDAGALSACQRIVETRQRGNDALTAVFVLVNLITELNDDREGDSPCQLPDPCTTDAKSFACPSG